MSDGEGRTLKVSSGCERIWGYKETELLGKTVYELEKRGIQSIDYEACVRKERKSINDSSYKVGKAIKSNRCTNKKYEGDIIRVVNISKDITEQNQSLQNEKNCSI